MCISFKLHVPRFTVMIWVDREVEPNGRNPVLYTKCGLVRGQKNYDLGRQRG
jgi:hypothetical protein